MVTELRTVPSTGRSVADPVPRSILAIDVEGIHAAHQPGTRRVPAHHVCPARAGAARHWDRPRAPGAPGRSRRRRDDPDPAGRRCAEDAPARPADPEVRGPAGRAQRDGHAAGPAAAGACGTPRRRGSRRRMGISTAKTSMSPSGCSIHRRSRKRAEGYPGVAARARRLRGDPLRDNPARLRGHRAADPVGPRTRRRAAAAWLGPHPGAGPLPNVPSRSAGRRRRCASSSLAIAPPLPRPEGAAAGARLAWP